MPKLIITRGLPGSGKSTLAKAYVAEQPDVRARVNRDDLRDMLQGGRLGTKEQEEAVTALQHASVRALLRAGWVVVCDDTNLYAKYARAFATIAVEEGAEFEVWDLAHVPLDVCISRDAARSDCVGEDVIRGMYERHIKPLRGRPKRFPPALPFPEPDGPDLSYVRPYVAPAGLPGVVLVDLDGTACLMGDRGPHDYHRVGEDTVNDAVREGVLGMSQRGHDVVFMSGRDEKCRPDTEAWLRRHYPELVDVVLGAPVLHMRAAGDQREDHVVKYELFQRHIAGRWRVAAVFDDRDQVVKMWRAMGLPVFQVAEGKF